MNMVVKYAYLHIMTFNPAKYECNQLSCFKGVMYILMYINSYKYCWNDITITYAYMYSDIMIHNATKHSTISINKMC